MAPTMPTALHKPQNTLSHTGAPYLTICPIASQLLRKLRNRHTMQIVELRELWLAVLASKEAVEVEDKDGVCWDAGACLSMLKEVVHGIVDVVQGTKKAAELVQVDCVRFVVGKWKKKPAPYLKEVLKMWNFMESKRSGNAQESRQLHKDVAQLMQMREFEAVEILRLLYDAIDAGTIKEEDDEVPTAKSSSPSIQPAAPKVHTSHNE